MITTVEEQFGKLNILVNNVGDFLELIKPFKNFTDDEIDALFNANLNSMFKVTRSAIPLLEKVAQVEALSTFPPSRLFAVFQQQLFILLLSMGLLALPAAYHLTSGL